MPCARRPSPSRRSARASCCMRWHVAPRSARDGAISVTTACSLPASVACWCCRRRRCSCRRFVRCSGQRRSVWPIWRSSGWGPRRRSRCEKRSRRGDPLTPTLREADVARRTIFSSESVTRGHPDKICDQLADAIVDAFLFQDPRAEVAAEGAIATGLVFLAVNTVGHASVDVMRIARDVITDIGYTQESGFDPGTCSVVTSVSHRAADPAETQRSQQASLFAYACLDAHERMQLPIVP